MGMFDKDDDWSPDIVYCKNCEHWERYGCTNGSGYCHNPKFEFHYDSRDYVFRPITEPNFYCADGEKVLKGWRCMICCHSLYKNAHLYCEKHCKYVSGKEDWCNDFERKEECQYGAP